MTGFLTAYVHDLFLVREKVIRHLSKIRWMPEPGHAGTCLLRLLSTPLSWMDGWSIMPCHTHYPTVPLDWAAWSKSYFLRWNCLKFSVTHLPKWIHDATAKRLLVQLHSDAVWLGQLMSRWEGCVSGNLPKELLFPDSVVRKAKPKLF